MPNGPDQPRAHRSTRHRPKQRRDSTSGNRMTQTPLATTAPQTQTNAHLDEAIQSLRQSFCDGLDEKICRIETAWIGLRKGQVDTNEALGLISHEAHRISGIAGSLGFAHA